LAGDLPDVGDLDLAKEVFSLDAVSVDGSSRLRPGQIRQVIAAADAPHGLPLRQTGMVEVTWTLDAGEEDLDVLRRHDHIALRWVRILRLIDEALDQGGESTQEDLAKALGVCVRTIRSYIAALKAEGYLVVTRGKLRGVGRVKDLGLPADGIGVHVAVACDVVGGGFAGENALFPPILFPATTVPITHIRLPATSAPTVRIASRDNERSRLT
jgi:biotin operon repressor